MLLHGDIPRGLQAWRLEHPLEGHQGDSVLPCDVPTGSLYSNSTQVVHLLFHCVSERTVSLERVKGLGLVIKWFDAPRFLFISFRMAFCFLIFLIHNGGIDTLIPKLWAHPSYPFCTINLCFFLLLFFPLGITQDFFFQFCLFIPLHFCPNIPRYPSLTWEVSGNICTSVQSFLSLLCCLMLPTKGISFMSLFSQILFTSNLRFKHSLEAFSKRGHELQVLNWCGYLHTEIEQAIKYKEFFLLVRMVALIVLKHGSRKTSLYMKYLVNKSVC